MRKLSTAWSNGVNKARNLLFPPTCVFCRTPVRSHGEACPECMQGVRVWPAARCRMCGRPLAGGLSPGPCGRCLRKSPPQQRTESLFVYKDAVRAAILDWKLHGRDAGVEWLLDAAAPRLRELFSDADVLLPIPMPTDRMRRAGRHHAADLCRALVARSGGEVNWRILRRNGCQARQSTLSGRARWKNLRKAFTVRDDCVQQMARAGTVWVVDDIMTTGATLYYACKAIRKCGVSACAFSLARLISGHEQNDRTRE